MSQQTSSQSTYSIPKKLELERLEEKWTRRWQELGVYTFDRGSPRERVYSIDTPPPTASGSLHAGHLFSYTHADIIARYQRMLGKAVFYPMGWDDNGLPTERRVENFYGVVCDAAAQYHPNLQLPETVPSQRSGFAPVSRRNFIEFCHRLTAIDELAFRELFTRLGVSVDWSLNYATIDERSQRISQRAFLRNLKRRELYNQEGPCLWDVTFQTAVAQAELEDRDVAGAYHDLRFVGESGQAVVISTTRPELLPACVALVIHPDDSRYRNLARKSFRCPLFGMDIPVLHHTLADPEKGTGVAMVCTFGDLTDVTWWRELNLPTRAIVGRDGRLKRETPDWIAAEEAKGCYARIAGQGLPEARREIVALLAENGALIGEPRPIRHCVKFFEKGDRPLEIIATRQWYLSNGGRDEQLREALLARGTALTWRPGFMESRYANWVSGLTGDWLISRQRVFGVSIPLWYRLDSAGNADVDSPVYPSEDMLPVDPQIDVPQGFSPEQRGQANGFIGEADVMDTWATSSLTPEISAGWGEEDSVFEQVFPMDLRPQAHDIIRTWLFSTVVRSHLEHGKLPWSQAVLSGWILNPDRKKMSKSKGNVVTPLALLDKYGSDGARYWAALGRPGIDTAFDETQMKNGRRLALKLLNATKFALGFGAERDATLSEQFDRDMMARLSDVVEAATDGLEVLDYSRAIEHAEAFFWWYCDDYVELVKERAREADAGALSARRALIESLSVLQRLFAPFLPFATEESWSWSNTTSIHRAAWPDAQTLRGFVGADARSEATEVVSDVLREVRRAKSEAKLSMKASAPLVRVTDSAPRLALLQRGQADLGRAGHIETLELNVGPALLVDVKLAP